MGSLYHLRLAGPSWRAATGAAARPAVVVSSAVTASHCAERRQISWPPARRAGSGSPSVPRSPDPFRKRRLPAASSESRSGNT